MSLFTKQELDSVAETIANVEKETDAELITVLASRADNYFYIPTLWASLVALITPLVMKFTPLWLAGDDLLLLQGAVFIGLALLFRIPIIMMRLVPKSVKQWRASNLARRQFLDNNLHHTKEETGVLIFISEAERYIEIIADRGISEQVDQALWQKIVDQLTDNIKQGRTHEGMISCIKQCGELLKKHAPATGSKNELPNHLIVL